MDYNAEEAEAVEVPYRLAQRPLRILHTMLRVRNLQKSLDFYIGALGMKLLRRQDYPSGRFTLAFVGYGDEGNSTVLELTHNWDNADGYEIGTAYGHIAIAVRDIYSTCAELAEFGVKITRAPGPMKFSPTVIAFIEDPDSYKIELIQRD